MELTFLGSGNAFASEGRYWSSFLVDRLHQFDAPPTLLAHLKQIGADLPNLETIFLSHHHADHFIGLPFLLLEYLYMTRRTKDLHIVGPPGVRGMDGGLRQPLLSGNHEQGRRLQARLH